MNYISRWPQDVDAASWNNYWAYSGREVEIMTKTHDDILEIKDAKKMVEEGYDQLAEEYAKADVLQEHNKKHIAWMIENLPDNARVLDLGCGPGVPRTKELARHFEVVGIDFSRNMIEQARKHVPEAEFHQMDMTKMTFEPESFHGMFSSYAIIHVPKELKAGLFVDIHRLLKSDGIIAFSIGRSDWTSEPGEEFMDVPMYWSQYGWEKTLAMIKETGFEIISSQIEVSVFQGEEERHFYVLARKI